MVKGCYLKHFGQPIIGDFEETLSGWKVTNPVMVIPNQNGVALHPVMSLFTCDTLAFKHDEILFNGPYDIQNELVNYYNQQYGSGIQLVSSLV